MAAQSTASMRPSPILSDGLATVARLAHRLQVVLIQPFPARCYRHDVVNACGWPTAHHAQWMRTQVHQPQPLPCPVVPTQCSRWPLIDHASCGCRLRPSKCLWCVRHWQSTSSLPSTTHPPAPAPLRLHQQRWPRVGIGTAAFPAVAWASGRPCSHRSTQQ